MMHPHPIVARLHELHAVMDTVKHVHVETAAGLDRIMSSILANVFGGKL